MEDRVDQLAFQASGRANTKAARGRRRRPRRRFASDGRGELDRRLALTRSEAAQVLGMSLDSFERYVQPEIRIIRRNSIRLVPVSELERWVDVNAALTLDEG
jgi:hypothetical protein